MRPKDFVPQETVIEARQDALARGEAAQVIIQKKQEVGSSAWAAIERLGGKGREESPGVDSVACSKVIVLERRSEPGVGEYFIVGKLFIDYTQKGTALERNEVKFKIGPAFSKSISIDSSKDIRELGKGVTEGQKWYGAWEFEESTEDVKNELDALRSGSLSSDIFAVRDTGLTKLNSLNESIQEMLKAAQNPELNPEISAESAVV